MNPVQYFNQSLFYVCADGFTDNVGQVVCRENTGTDFVTRDSLLRSTLNATHEIYSEVFHCVGSEDSLCQCNTTAQDCSSDLVAQVQCSVVGKIYIF